MYVLMVSAQIGQEQVTDDLNLTKYIQYKGLKSF